jgi:hypothetical protein
MPLTAPAGPAGRRAFCLVCTGLAMLGPGAKAAPQLEADSSLAAWSARFASEVDRRLEVPLADQVRYFALLERALGDAQLQDLPEQAFVQTFAQAFVLVDRCAQVQAAMVIVRAANGTWHWLGATAVSTGKVGTYEHFLSPLGVFAHSLDNPDYRAEGTFNKNRIRGYGLRGRRIFDFGWQDAERGWGSGGISKMRLQMHATDPTVLEPRLGRVASEGCIRIPATLNVFLDIYGVLDADYEAAVASGKTLWVLNPKRQPVPWPGRYLVIVDTQLTERPTWSPAPQA